MAEVKWQRKGFEPKLRWRAREAPEGKQLMAGLCFCIINQSTKDPGYGPAAASVLEQMANSLANWLNQDVAPFWGGIYFVRYALDGALQPGEVPCYLVDSDAAVPNAAAYHDRQPDGTPIVYVMLDEFDSWLGGGGSSKAPVSVGLGHEMAETAADPGANRWADRADGSEEAFELCLAGYTEVRLADGSTMAIRDMAHRGGFYNVVAATGVGIGVARAGHARMTHEASETVIVTLSDGSTVCCTANHKLLLSSGVFVAAEDLRPGDSLLAAPRSSSSFVQLEREPMREYTLVANGELSVPSGVFSSAPQPAGGGRAASDLVPKTSFHRRGTVVERREAPSSSAGPLIVHCAHPLSPPNPSAPFYRTLHSAKVVARVQRGVTQPVYDLTVPGARNFAVGAGVFVHNCDRCQGTDYTDADGVAVPNFLLPSAFDPGASTPYDKQGALSSVTGMTPNGYVITRQQGVYIDAAGVTTAYTVKVAHNMSGRALENKKHYSSRAHRRGWRP